MSVHEIRHSMVRLIGVGLLINREGLDTIQAIGYDDALDLCHEACEEVEFNAAIDFILKGFASVLASEHSDMLSDEGKRVFQVIAEELDGGAEAPSEGQEVH